MLFTSIGFFVFLPVVLVVYTALPARARPPWLLAASYAFYAASRPANLVFLGAVTLATWGCGWAMENTRRENARRALLAAGLAAVIGSLFAFKFHDFVAGEVERLAGSLGARPGPWLPRIGLTAPAGYSFYAFSAAAYLVDAFVRRLPGSQSAAGVALYLAWFPKILAGPIERAGSFLPQALTGLLAHPTRLVLGLQLVGWGLFKKVVIADNLGPFVDRTFGIAAYASPLDLLFAVYFFAFQIYCDFSGYTDIARGVSQLFGIELSENFRRPYLSRSTAEFWGQRWHVSLGHWFRDYLYVPLGGSRAGPLRQYLNLMLVFLVSGLWHAGLGYGVGWTFLLWGALNGAYQWAGVATRPIWLRAGKRLPRLARSAALRVLRTVATFHLIAVTWVFFRARSIGEAWLVLRKIGSRLAEVPSLVARYPFAAEHYTGFALIAFLVCVEIVDERRPVFERLEAVPTFVRWAVWYLAIFALLAMGRWQAKEFIYMQF
jgi:alginate O-acetyltransferase complex protein AlgI